LAVVALATRVVVLFNADVSLLRDVELGGLLGILDKNLIEDLPSTSSGGLLVVPYVFYRQMAPSTSSAARYKKASARSTPIQTTPP
jgi:hypothetical protein